MSSSSSRVGDIWGREGGGGDNDTGQRTISSDRGRTLQYHHRSLLREGCRFRVGSVVDAANRDDNGSRVTTRSTTTTTTTTTEPAVRASCGPGDGMTMAVCSRYVGSTVQPIRTRRWTRQRSGGGSDRHGGHRGHRRANRRRRDGSRYTSGRVRAVTSTIKIRLTLDNTLV